MIQLKSLFALVLVMALTACGTTPERNAGIGSDAEVSADTAPGVAGEPVEVLSAQPMTAGDAAGQPLDDMKMVDVAELYEPVIYFEYDQFELNDKNTAVVKHFAEIMLSNPRKKVIIQGNTDERGTPEYNLALGEKRAKTVAQAMTLFGVSESRMDVVSFGEEQPVDEGSNEMAWQKNRRVELIIR